ETYAASEPVGRELSYWTSQATPPRGRVPLAHGGGSNREASARHVVVRLSPEDTHALGRDVPRAYRTQIHDVPVTALVAALAGWTGARTWRLDVEGHGREEIGTEADLSRTVGWFTTLFPVQLTLPEDDDPGVTLRAVKEQLRTIPRRGIGYGVLRYL